MNAKHQRDRQSPRVSAGPFARPLNVHDVPREGLQRTITATEQECAAIAQAVDLPAVGRVAADLTIKPRAGGLMDVTGLLRAAITQVCVVSLEPFESAVEQQIDLTFAPAVAPDEYRPPKRRDRDAAPAPVRPTVVPGNDDQQDPADPIIDDTIDLGAVALEFLVLACDIYPRKPDVHFTDAVIGDNDEPEPSAFAMLQRLKDRS